jgi:acyl-coenzyme A synthetase/AMP-(fatty) acid ligase
MTAARATPATAGSLPLLRGHDASTIVAWRHDRPVRAAEFLDDVARVAAALPPCRHVLNTCADRYRFAVGFAAIATSGRTSLLPSTLTRETIERLREIAPDVVELADAPAPHTALPHVDYEAAIARQAMSTLDAALEARTAVQIPPDARLATGIRMPAIPADAVVACVFTSGSTGAPVPHRKTWGALVRSVEAEAAALGLADGRAHAILGTVPAQHMYGFESTVLQPLVNGLAFAASRPLYPADICAALDALPRPRVLVTTPFHLRTLLDADVAMPAIDLVVSATAPLSRGLAREAESRLRAMLVEIYGATETGQIASRRTTSGVAWRLFPGVRLALRGVRAIASGGHVEGEVPLDDVLEPVGDDEFLLHGRSADMVNIAGKRSSLGYLNHQLCAVPGVVDGAFFRGDEAVDGVTRLSAAVVAPALDRASLVSALRERVDAAFVPRRIVFVERLPRNATGKLPAAALAALFGESN